MVDIINIRIIMVSFFKTPLDKYPKIQELYVIYRAPSSYD